MRLIDADDVIATIEEKQKALCPIDGRQYVYGDDRVKFDAWDEILDVIDNIPTVEAEPVRHGTGVKVSDRSPRYVCTSCQHLYYKSYQRCPNCGAKMEG